MLKCLFLKKKTDDTKASHTQFVVIFRAKHDRVFVNKARSTRTATFVGTYSILSN